MKKKNRNKNKITNQRFDTAHVSSEIKRLISYQSDALHWNLEQVDNDNIIDLIQKANKAYEKISQQTGVIMHSEEKISEKIKFFMQDKKNFMLSSRKFSIEAQKREAATLQPKENINIGEKASLTINNFVGGNYYFTADEARIDNDILYIIEAKHSSRGPIPSVDDIKDGLLKMILVSNLKKAVVQDKEYKVVPILKLTGRNNSLKEKQKDILNFLTKEAADNGFGIDYRGGRY